MAGNLFDPNPEAHSWVAASEWVKLFAVDLFQVMRNKGQMGSLAQLVQQDAKLQKFLKDFQLLTTL